MERTGIEPASTDNRQPAARDLHAIASEEWRRVPPQNMNLSSLPLFTKEHLAESVRQNHAEQTRKSVLTSTTEKVGVTGFEPATSRLTVDNQQPPAHAPNMKSSNDYSRSFPRPK